MMANTVRNGDIPRPRRILIIDDDVPLSRLFRLRLQDAAGYEVRVENSGLAGLASVAEFEPDLIVLDVVMPGMSGREVAAVLGADPVLRKIPILFVTAFAPDGPPDSWDAKLDGHPRFIKPFGIAKVVAAIDAMTAGPPGGS